MKVIWEYDIPQKENFELDLPKGAVILNVHAQKEEPKIWALVNPKAEIETRKFVIKPTGGETSNTVNLPYIGTYFLYKESLVFHLFENIE